MIKKEKVSRSLVISFIGKKQCSATSVAAGIRQDARCLREINASLYARGKPKRTQMNAQEWEEKLG